jgi:hypothetical protein
VTSAKTKTHLEVQDDGPDEAKCELWITCGVGKRFRLDLVAIKNRRGGGKEEISPSLIRQHSESKLAVNNILRSDVHKLNLLKPQKVQCHLNVLQHVKSHFSLFARLK